MRTIVLVVSLVFCACSSTPSQPPLNPNACQDIINAGCQKQVQCQPDSGTVSECEQGAAGSCVDSTIPQSQVNACVNAIVQESCTDVNAGLVPTACGGDAG